MISVGNLKKTCFTLLASVLLLPVYALSYQGFDVEVLEAENDGIEGFVVTGYRGEDQIVTIPSNIGGIPVLEIGDEAFSGNRGISFVIIPETVSKIGLRAFYNCTGLEIIKIPDSVTQIGANAFAYAENLKKIRLPSNITVIEESLFANCYSLTEIRIPDSVTQIKTNAFSHCDSLKILVFSDNATSIAQGILTGCKSLETVKLPAKMQKIPGGFFAALQNLESVTIPKDVKVIERGAFADCPKISVKVDSRNENFRAIQKGKGLISTDGKTLVSYFGSKSNLIISDNFTQIAPNAFAGNKKLKSITIPRTITKIGSDAFADCTNLFAVNIENIGAWNKIDFENSGANPLRHAKAFNLNGNTVRALSFGSSVSEIKPYAYSGYRELVSVSFGTSVTVVGKEAFADCTGLKYVKNLEKNTKIGKDAFRNVPYFFPKAEQNKISDAKQNSSRENPISKKSENELKSERINSGFTKKTEPVKKIENSVQKEKPNPVPFVEEPYTAQNTEDSAKTDGEAESFNPKEFEYSPDDDFENSETEGAVYEFENDGGNFSDFDEYTMDSKIYSDSTDASSDQETPYAADSSDLTQKNTDVQADVFPAEQKNVSGEELDVISSDEFDEETDTMEEVGEDAFEEYTEDSTERKLREFEESVTPPLAK